MDEICKCDHCKLLSSTDNGHVVSCGAGCYSCNAESVDEKSVDETVWCGHFFYYPKVLFIF